MGELTIDVREWEATLKVFSTATAPVEAQITVDGDAKNYWAVLEFGSREGQRPWPEPKRKTRRGADGRIFSKQAPGGYIFRHMMRFIDYLAEAYDRAFRDAQGPPDQQGLEKAVGEAAERSLKLIRDGAPVDSGKLRDSLKVEKVE